MATRRVVVRLYLQFLPTPLSPPCSPTSWCLGAACHCPCNVHLSASLATTSWEGGAEQELLIRPTGREGFAGICEIKQEILYKHVCTTPCVCVCTFIFGYGQTASLLRAVSFARLVLCVELPVCSDIRRHFLLLISCFFFSFFHILLSRHAHVLCPARQSDSQAAIRAASCFAFVSTAFIYL